MVTPPPRKKGVFWYNKNMGKNINKYLYWTPRILSIIFICFLALFSLDVFEPGFSFWQIVVGLLIHNIPAFVLLAVLIISWKREIVGGVVFILAGLLYTVTVIPQMFGGQIGWWGVSWILTIAGPAFLIGILFIINWLKKRNNQKDIFIK